MLTLASSNDDNGSFNRSRRHLRRIGSLAALASATACDHAGVIIWKRRHGFAWIDKDSAAAGDVAMRRDGFATMTDAAADACAVLGLDRRWSIN